MADALGVVSVACEASMCTTWSRECNEGAAEGGGSVAIVAVAAVQDAGGGDDEDDESVSEVVLYFKGPWLAENEAMGDAMSVCVLVVERSKQNNVRNRM